MNFTQMAIKTQKRKVYIPGDILLLNVQSDDPADKIVKVVRAHFESTEINYETATGGYAYISRGDIAKQLTREEAEQMAEDYINKKQPALERAQERLSFLEVKYHDAEVRRNTLGSDISRAKGIIKLVRGEK